MSINELEQIIVLPFIALSPILFPKMFKKDVSMKSNVAKVPSIVKFYATFSQATYWTKRTDKQFGSMVWKYKPEMSSEYQAVWTHGKTAVYSIRGTHIVNPFDQPEDNSIIFYRNENLSRRVGWASRRLRSLVKKYDRVIFVGHSMGGAIVLDTMRKMDAKIAKKITAVALDPVSTRKFIKNDPFANKKVYIYRTAGDIVSVPSRLIKATHNVTYAIKNPLLSPHTLLQLL